jgi:hypothetical protein
MVEIRRLGWNGRMRKRDLEKEVLALRADVARALEKSETCESELRLLKMSFANILRDRCDGSERLALRAIELLDSKIQPAHVVDQPPPPGGAPVSNASGAEPQLPA